MGLNIYFFGKEMIFAQFHGEFCILEFVEDLLEMVQMVSCGLTVDKHYVMSSR